jgi:hypothetical protein
MSWVICFTRPKPLGACLSLLDPFRPKPKGMHWRSNDALLYISDEVTADRTRGLFRNFFRPASSGAGGDVNGMSSIRRRSRRTLGHASQM